MLLWLYRLFGSPFARSFRAPCPIPDLGIRAGDLLDYDPADPDVLIHARVISRREVGALIDRDRRGGARGLLGDARGAVPRPPSSASPAAPPGPPLLRLVR